MQDIKLDDLYQELILDHNKRPRNYRKVENANAYSHGHNPLCGDDYHLYLLIDREGVIREVGFEGQGCAISKSSASMMTTMLDGKNIKEAGSLGQEFVGFLTKDHASPEAVERLGRLKIFEGVKKFPVRVKCATLAWHALADALKDFKKEDTK